MQKIAIIAAHLNSTNGYGSFAKSFSEAIGGQVISGFGSGIKGFFFGIIKVLILTKNADIIHALDGWPFGVFGAISSIVWRKKLVITLQGTYAIAPLYSKKGFLLKLAYNRAQCVAVSNYTAHEAKKKLGYDIPVINHGVNTEVFKKEGIKKKYILGVGALKERKGFHVSIEAFKLFSNPEFEYLIVGNGPSKEELKKQAHGYKIRFFDSVSEKELVKLYQEASAFVLTPISKNHHFEGYGLVYAEAAACGTPSIGTKDCGAEDIATVLVRQNSPQETAEAIKKIFGIKPKKVKSWKEIAQEYKKIYE